MSEWPPDAQTRKVMQQAASALDDYFNPGPNKTVGFALLTYRFGEPLEGTGRINYIGNGAREDVFVALKELVARWEGHREATQDPT